MSTAPPSESQAQSEGKALYFKVKAPILKLDPKEIMWVEEIDRYVQIQTVSRRYMVHISLKEISDMLRPANFIQVNNSFVVSLSRVTAVNTQTLVIGKMMIPIGKSYQKAVLARV